VSTLAVAPTPAVIKPVPWYRMGWVAWRRYRTTAIGIGALLAVMASYLLITGHRARSAYAAVVACKPAHSADCNFMYQNFHNNFGGGNPFNILLLLLPGIVGAFMGAPLLARELESGTFRYTWTQAAGRMRWTVTMLISGALGGIVVMTAFGALNNWAQQPLINAGIVNRLHPSIFPVMGVAVAAWTLTGFSLGVLAGVLVRRVLPALAGAFAIWFGMAYVAATFLRPRYLTPLTTTGASLDQSNLVIDSWWTKGGLKVSTDQLNSILQSIGIEANGNGFTAQTANPTDPYQYLLQHGYLQVTSYQPATRYWTFQWIESGWLVVLSAVLLGLTLWLLRRRSG
jgi:hypothetical protein